MSYEWKYRELFIGPALVICPRCHQVPDEDYDLLDPCTPMPCCGATGQKIPWPSKAAQILLDVIRHRDTFVGEGEPVRFIFLEAILEPIVFRLSAQRNGEARATKELGDNHGASKLRKLFDEHSQSSLMELCTAADHPDFVKQWQEVARLRNAFAHGRAPNIKPAQKRNAQQVEESALHVFAYIHNHARPK